MNLLWESGVGLHKNEIRHWVEEGFADLSFHVWVGRSVLLVHEVM